jgi:hypothetical protein
MPTIEDGKNAATQGNLQQARLIFEALLQENPRSEDAWLGLADVLTDTNDKRICYENVLKINKNSRAAREGLRNLEPEEDPFVAALKQSPPTPVEDEAPLSDTEETAISDRSDMFTPEEAKSETPTAVLVAVGLGLSVIVFAVVSGLLYFVITSLIAP